MVNIAKGRPQALLKITSFGKGTAHVGRHARYIMRNGELALETETGEVVGDLGDARDMIREWSAEGFGSRKNARDTAHMVLGVPPGADREQLSHAVRAFAAEAFGGHRYAWVRHDDTQAPHVHLMLHLTNQDTGRKLNPRKTYLQQTRERFAHHCREYGIDVDASRAWERGRSPRSKSQQIEYHARSRGQVLDKNRVMVTAARAEMGVPHAAPKPWEAARQANAAERRGEFEGAAAQLAAVAGARDGEDRGALYAAAASLRDFAQRIRARPTRHQEVAVALLAREREQSRERGPEL